MQISESGKISVHVSLGKYDHLFTNPIVLDMSNAGIITGDIYLWVIPVGKVDGSISPAGNIYGRISTPLFNVGSVSGHLGGNGGAGTYQSIAGNGSWSARRN